MVTGGAPGAPPVIPLGRTQSTSNRRQVSRMRILAVGDSFVPVDTFRQALAGLEGENEVRYLDLDMDAVFVPRTDSDRAIREYAGNPQQLVDALDGADVLLVHGAPVTAEVLDASPNLRVVGVARGGPVNVDVEAATARGIAVISAPGRNADAVADLTLAFMVMLARGILRSLDFLRNGGRLGESTFEGAQFFGHELGRHTLGLVGYGNVGSRVARRARAFGMHVLVYDPYVEPSQIREPGIEVTGLDQVVEKADFISLHARSTKETENLFDAQQFRRMKPGSYFINTARETLVDEEALYDALASGHLAGAALDVTRSRADGSTTPLLRLENVIITPHIGGATFEAALLGVEILADQLQEYVATGRLEHPVNPVEPVAPR